MVKRYARKRQRRRKSLTVPDTMQLIPSIIGLGIATELIKKI